MALSFAFRRNEWYLYIEAAQANCKHTCPPRWYFTGRNVIRNVKPIFALVSQGAYTGSLQLLITRQYEGLDNEALRVTLIEKRKGWGVKGGGNGFFFAFVKIQASWCGQWCIKSGMRETKKGHTNTVISFSHSVSRATFEIKMFFKACTHCSDCSFNLLFLGATVWYLTEYRINIRLKLLNERLRSLQEK